MVPAVVDQLAAADAALDPALLAPRVSGPAAEMRAAGYTVRRAMPEKGVLTPVGGERLVDVVPQEQEWPRTVMTVTQAAADDIDLSDFAGWSDPERIVANVQAAYRAFDPRVPAPTVAEQLMAMAGWPARH